MVRRSPGFPKSQELFANGFRLEPTSSLSNRREGRVPDRPVAVQRPGVLRVLPRRIPVHPSTPGMLRKGLIATESRIIIKNFWDGLPISPLLS